MGFAQNKKYKFINIHQRAKTEEISGARKDTYKFINIHQRAKTKLVPVRACILYKFINIHQRAKTTTYCIICDLLPLSTQLNYNSRISRLSR